MNTHLHITAWALGIILFVVAYFLMKQGKAKPAKIVHMVLRLVYLFILYSGGELVWSYIETSQMPVLAEAITKGLAGIWIIAAMELVLVKTGKGASARGPWIQFWIALILVLLLGFGRLPFGVQLF